MTEGHRIDLEGWVRRDHYNFFKKFEEPFFGITVQVECQRAYQYCKDRQLSFFLYYLYLSLRAVNAVEPFRYRISGEEVFCYDQVHASPTINRDNGTFGFAYLPYYPHWNEFVAQAQQEIQRVKNSSGLVPAVSGENVIHYSSLPWISFTALSHARSFSFADSCPKISFGKIGEQGKKKLMPVSVFVHHALMDGYQVAQFVDLFQELLQEEQQHY